MTHASASRVSLALALIALFVAATPSLWAQEDQWEKHFKAGEKAYHRGVASTYGTFFGPNPRSAHDFAEAEKEFLAALAQTQAFPAGDLRTARTLSTLGDVYTREGKFDDAENRWKQAIAILEASLKPDDPRLGYALIGMALSYEFASKPDQAAPIWKRSLALLEKSGGQADPAMLDQMHSAAVVLSMTDKYPEAKVVYQAILELREATGTSDVDLRKSLLDLVNATVGANETSEREPLEIRIVEIDKRAYAPDSPATSSDLQLLAATYIDEGKYAAAVPLLQRSLEISRKAPQPSESNIQKSFEASALLRLDRQLAEAYAGAGKYPEAEELYKQILPMDENEPHSDETGRSMSQNNDLRGLSKVYLGEHRYDDAVDAVKRSEAFAEKIAESKFGKSKGASVWLWLSASDLAEIYREKGDLAAAEPLFQQSLEMSGKLQLAHGHIELARLLDNYATLLRDEGKYSDAEPLYKRSLDTWAKGRCPDHPDAAVALTNYAALLRKVNRPAEAEPLEARAAAIRAKLGTSTPAQ